MTHMLFYLGVFVIRNSFQMALIAICMTLLSSQGNSAWQAGVPLPNFTGQVASTDREDIVNAKILITWTDTQTDLIRDWSIPPSRRILGEATSQKDGSYGIEWKQVNIPVIEHRDEQSKRFALSEPDFLLTVFHDGYVPYQKQIRINSSDPLETKIDMESGIPFTNRVVDERGIPIARAKVRFEGYYVDVKHTKLASPNALCPIFNRLDETPFAETDELGEFLFPSLPRSKLVILRVQHPEYPSVTRLQFTRGKLPTPPDLSRNLFARWWEDLESDIRVSKKSLVSLTVLDATTNQPLENIEIAPLYSGISAKSGAEGKASLPIEVFPKNNAVYVRSSMQDAWKLVALENESDRLIVRLKK